ncbi:DMT family transporter [Aeromicrobium halocynthiae]|uniref:DMT family transporter n=1 Tax=Aeromicrobium halocynthiae TaxID=560557 RepID=A0ABN2VUG6_9ACTN
MSTPATTRPTRDLTVLALTTVVVVWASAFVGIRALAGAFDPAALTLGRLLVGAAALTLIARPWRHRLPRGRTLALTVAYGVVWFGVYNVALNAAEVSLDAGTTALIVNIGPLLIALGAGLFLGEGFPRPLVLGLAVAFSGVAVIALSTRESAEVGADGVLLAVGAALAYAAGALLQKPTLRTVRPAFSTWLGCSIGALACLPFGPRLVEQVADASVGEVAWLVYLGVLPTAVGFVAWSYAIERLSAGTVASTTYLVPATAIVISWILLAEVPAPLAFVGGALCLAGVAITRWRPRTRTPAPA